MGAHHISASASAKRFVALDSLRGLAAVGVMFFHLWAAGLIRAPIWGWPDLLVDFFFVLSGFVITAAYGERLAHGFSRSTFLLLRLGRLYPLHLVVVCGFAATKIASGRSLLAGQNGLGHLARALLLLDGYVPELTNFFSGVSWSISVELAAYALSAWLFGRRSAGLIIVLALWTVALIGFVDDLNVVIFTRSLQRCLIGFGLGAAAWHVHERFRQRITVQIAGLLELPALALAGVLTVWFAGRGWFLPLTDVAFAAVVLVFAREAGPASRIACARPLRALGRWSYSIYLIHPLVIMLAIPGFAALQGRLPQSGLGALFVAGLTPAADGALMAVVAAITIAGSAMSYRWIEQPGREWARRRAMRRGAGPAERIAPTI